MHPATAAHASAANVVAVVLNRNRANDTLDCVRSLRALDYPGCAIVVVDNGSTDDSVARVHQGFPDVSIIETGKNLGFAGGANVGIRHALRQCAEYIWLLNNDTVVDARALAALVETAERDPNVGLVGSVIYSYYERNQIQAWGGGSINWWIGTTKHWKGPGDLRLDYICGCSLLIKREVLMDVGLLNERLFFYWEDVDLAVRARQHGWGLAVASGSRVYHKGGASVGWRSPLADYLETRSLTVFLMEHLGTGAVAPLAVRLGGKVVNRILRRQLSHVVHLCRGVRDGLATSSRPTR